MNKEILYSGNKTLTLLLHHGEKIKQKIMDHNKVLLPDRLTSFFS